VSSIPDINYTLNEHSSLFWCQCYETFLIVSNACQIKQPILWYLCYMYFLHFTLNTLAYSGEKVTKLFSSSLILRQNKLEFFTALVKFVKKGEVYVILTILWTNPLAYSSDNVKKLFSLLVMLARLRYLYFGTCNILWTNALAYSGVSMIIYVQWPVL
jgi:hypothetical protein